MSRESWLRTGERSKRRGEGSHFGMIDAGKFLRRGVSDDSAIFEKNDARGEKERFAKVVGDKDDGFAETAGEGAEFALKLGAGDGIESAERLVHEENGRIGGKGASDADALTLAAGEFVRTAIDKFQKRGFAAAAAAQEDEGLAGSDGEADVVNNRVRDPTVKTVCHILELNSTVGVPWRRFRIHFY